MQIAVGGCLAQKDRAAITARAPWVDVVFGTHNIGSLPVLLQRARVLQQAQVEIVESLERFPSVLPASRDCAYSGWVAISVGCNNSCTFCIVPSLRGREEDRRPGDVLAEIRALVAEGVVEITLLGQNVNSYGAAFGDRRAFGKLLRACGEIDGLERVRFTSPHPRDFTDDVIDAMAQTPNVMPQLHMPLQSGSDAVLRAMRRAYRREKYLAILEKVRAAMPDAAITTDIIVGFPGETERDFADTLDIVRQARFSGAFTFQYSIRPGTPAAALAGQVPADVVRDRYERLAAAVAEITLAENLRAGRQRHRGAGRRGRGAQGRRHPPDVGAGARQPACAFHPRWHRAAARRHGDDRRDPRRAELPDRGRIANGGAADPRRRCVGIQARCRFRGWRRTNWQQFRPGQRHARPGAARHAGRCASRPRRCWSRPRSARIRHCSSRRLLAAPAAAPSSAPMTTRSWNTSGPPVTRRWRNCSGGSPT